MSISSTHKDRPSLAYFQDDESHIAAEIEWVAELLRLAILENRRADPEASRFDEYSGLYVSEQEIAQFIDGTHRQSTATEIPHELARRIDLQRQAVASFRDRIDAFATNSMAQGVSLRLLRLAEKFRLSSADYVAFVCCLAPDLDEQLQKCFAYLQNEVARRRPSAGLLTKLCRVGNDPLAPWRLLGPESTLLANRLLELPSATSSENKPLRLLEPRVPREIIGYVAGEIHVAGVMGMTAKVEEPREADVSMRYYDYHRQLADRLVKTRASCKTLPLTYVSGPPGCDKGLVADEVARVLGMRLMRLDPSKLTMEPTVSGDAVRTLIRDARLFDCIVHMKAPEYGQDESSLRAMPGLRQMLIDCAGLDIILCGDKPATYMRTELGLAIDEYEVPPPAIGERAELWSWHFAHSGIECDERISNSLAGKFRFGPSQIRAVLRGLRPDVGDALQVRDGDAGLNRLYRSCRNESNQGLERYTNRVKPNYRWTDIVLPDDTLNQLREICNCVDHRQTVFGTWGFEEKFSLGKGLNVLFCGNSGTGKTMSAEIVAGDLGLDLYKIDLSSVVSKYIGETERNLARIFDEAETSNSILFFDEADALFGKRSDVKDAHDRYANIEINYLLQKLDEYEGIIVLATNLQNNLDAAFTRRFNYTVEFPFPDETFRERIWHKVFPDQAPVDNDVDFRFLAERFRLAGGNIKNIALNSAFMAATAAADISMEHVILAVKREYQKLGKLCTKSEYGPYFSLVRDKVAA